MKNILSRWYALSPEAQADLVYHAMYVFRILMMKQNPKKPKVPETPGAWN